MAPHPQAADDSSRPVLVEKRLPVLVEKHLPSCPPSSSTLSYSQDGEPTRFNLKFFCNRRHSLNSD